MKIEILKFHLISMFSVRHFSTNKKFLSSENFRIAMRNYYGTVKMECRYLPKIDTNPIAIKNLIEICSLFMFYLPAS